MKIPQSIRSIYEDLELSYSKLKKLIDYEFKNTLPQEWHYISRLKRAESFALKIESGQVLVYGLTIYNAVFRVSFLMIKECRGYFASSSSLLPISKS